MSGALQGNAIGSLADMCRRMRAVLPLGWFAVPDDQAGSTTPILDGLLSGIGFAWQWSYDFVSFVREQARIATATGSFLDFICADFFGSMVARYPGEIDVSLRSRIASRLLSEAGTRGAISRVVLNATGVAPVIREGRQGSGLGGYGLGGYGIAGFSYGSGAIPFASLVTCVPGGSYSARQTTATYADNNNTLHTVGSNVLRLSTSENGEQIPLLEGRSFNFIKNSVNWVGFNLPAACSVSVPGSGVAGVPFWPACVATVTVSAGGQVTGPGITVAVADHAITVSLWINVIGGGDLTALQINVIDEAGQSTAGSIGTTPGWQRVQVTHSRVSSGPGTVRMVLEGVAIAGGGILQTQCWQIEAGSTATSYIPSDGSMNFRDGDTIVACAIATAFVQDRGTRDQMVCAALPAGTNTWIRDLQ